MSFPPDDRPPLAGRTIAALAALKLALHVGVNATSAYGFHRDEFLYFAMGRHLRLFGMDFPPAIALLSEAVRGLLGVSLVAIRLVPALAGTAVLVLAALIARELGGGRFAQATAALAVLASPLFLRSANLFQPVVLDQLAWTVGLFALVRLSRETRPHWWLLLGLAAGFGLLAKFSIAFFMLPALAAILLTPLRRALAGPWPWVALALALVIGSPSIIGQLRLGFPVVQQMSDLRAEQLERVGPAEFIGGQLRLGPAFALALAGLVGLLVAPTLRRFRVVGWTCLGAFLLLLALQGKPYYLGPVYPALFAAGATLLERVRAPRLGAMLRAGAVALLVLYGIATLPFGVPILPPAPMARYAEAMGVTAAVRTNTGEVDRLPQDYADMLGWEEQAGVVARVYHGLAPADRARAVVLAGNYGEAGAIDFFGERLGLPRAVSPAGSYWFFGPGPLPGEVLVTIGLSPEDLAPYFADVRVAARAGDPWAVAEERELDVLVARGPRHTLQAVWPSLAGRN